MPEAHNGYGFWAYDTWNPRPQPQQVNGGGILGTFRSAAQAIAPRLNFFSCGQPQAALPEDALMDSFSSASDEYLSAPESAYSAPGPYDGRFPS
jgi:hypothetical protein